MAQRKEVAGIQRTGLIVATVILFISIFTIFEGSSAEPKSAEGMTEEERLANDTEIILSELESVEVSGIEIHYGKDVIELHLTGKSTDQYISDQADTVDDTLTEVLEDRRADLTLEKEPRDYIVLMYGSDNKRIIK